MRVTLMQFCCDLCGEFSEVFNLSYYSVGDATQELREKGWVRGRRRNPESGHDERYDRCSECTAKAVKA